MSETMRKMASVPTTSPAAADVSERERDGDEPSTSSPALPPPGKNLFRLNCRLTPALSQGNSSLGERGGEQVGRREAISASLEDHPTRTSSFLIFLISKEAVSRHTSCTYVHVYYVLGASVFPWLLERLLLKQLFRFFSPYKHRIKTQLLPSSFCWLN